jgi:hypothetical protein
MVARDADDLVLRVQLGYMYPRLTSFENYQNLTLAKVFDCLYFSARPCASEEYVPETS